MVNNISEILGSVIVSGLVAVILFLLFFIRRKMRKPLSKIVIFSASLIIIGIVLSDPFFSPHNHIGDILIIIGIITILFNVIKKTNNKLKIFPIIFLIIFILFIGYSLGFIGIVRKGCQQDSDCVGTCSHGCMNEKSIIKDFIKCFIVSDCECVNYKCEIKY